MSTATTLVNACLLPAYDGRVPPDWILRALDAGIAGVGLFGTNLHSTGRSLREDIVDPIRAVRPDALIALDEEGGDVTRLDYHRGSVYPGNHALGSVDDPELTRQVALAVGSDLREAGINLCLGPCADVNSRATNPIIGVRSFGSRPGPVDRHTRAFVRGLQERGVAATLKHFPGHGDTGTDSHTALPDIHRGLDALRALDLPPFAGGIAAGAKAVMTGHIRLPHLCDLPATLSRRIVTGLLREDLGYDGVVISDALEMAPVRDRWGFGGAAVLAWAAGVDLVLLGATDGESILPEVHRAAQDALRTGALTVERMEEAAARVAALRAWAAPTTAHPAPASAASAYGIGLVAARRALSTAGLPAVGPGEPVHTVRLLTGGNMAVGTAPWGLAPALKLLDALACATDVEPDTDPRDIDLPDTGPVAVVVRDAALDPWQDATLRALRARRPDLVTVDMGLGPRTPEPGSRVVLTRGAGLVNAVAAAELLTGRTWTGPLRT
ncbi:glycoside hydrolase family 3 N-terminal domain-containing protein [Streptomyces sp. NPDC048383]|uniref:glycoside hydrolase family 3 protein n=1 Tax=Streptomyces sp. NPDC048383 TaxID=3155386 RepID=UPI00341DE139